MYALAHATGKTGRFTLIERWRNNERLLAPQDHPVTVIYNFVSLYFTDYLMYCYYFLLGVNEMGRVCQ